MRARRRSGNEHDPAFRDDVDELAVRIDALAAMVRDACGSVSAVQGDLTRTQRRLDDEARRAAQELSRAQDEIAALRRKAAQAPAPAGRPTPTPAPAQPTASELSVLADRVATLTGMVRENAGRVVAGEGGLASLKSSLAEDGARVEEALDGIRRELAALRARVSSAAQRPEATPDARLDGRITSLGDRIDALSEAVREASGGVVATRGELSTARGEIARMDERATEVERLLDARSSETRQAVARLERELQIVRESVGADPASREQALRLADSVQTLGDRIDTIAGIVRETMGQAATTVPGEAAAVLEQRLELLTARVESLSGQLHDTAAAAVVATAAASDEDAESAAARVEALTEALDRMRERVDGLALDAGDAGATFDESLVRRISDVERDQAELRTQVAASIADLADESVELRRELTEVVEDVASIRGDVAAVEERTEGVAGDVTTLQDGQDALARAIGDATQDIERIDDALSGLRVEHDELAADVVAAKGSQDAIAGSVEDLRADHAALERSVQAVTRDATGLAIDLDELRQSHKTLARDMESVSVVAQQALARPLPDAVPVLHDLAAKLERIDEDRRIVAEQLADVERTWGDEREQLRRRLEELTLTTALGAPAEDAERVVSELTVRLDRLERERASVSDIASLAEGWKNTLGVLAARVEYGLIRLGQADQPPATQAEAQELVELSQRIASMEQDRDRVLGELSKATDTWAAERAALHERVAELAARIVTGPVEAPEVVSTATVDLGDAGKELDRLRIALEGMRMRLAYHEKAVAELGGGGDLAGRIEALATRLDGLQAAVASGEGGGVSSYAGAGGSLLGIDVTDLLQRVERAEALAHKQHKDMLGHLERIAAKMDWRLHRLEHSETDAHVVV
jgi:chromosome segregation ATPase